MSFMILLTNLQKVGIQYQSKALFNYVLGRACCLCTLKFPPVYFASQTISYDPFDDTGCMGHLVCFKQRYNVIGTADGTSNLKDIHDVAHHDRFNKSNDSGNHKV